MDFITCGASRRHDVEQVMQVIPTVRRLTSSVLDVAQQVHCATDADVPDAGFFAKGCCSGRLGAAGDVVPSGECRTRDCVVEHVTTVVQADGGFF